MSDPFDGVDQKTKQLFMAYHRANPTIWIAFEKLAIDLIDRGLKRYGAKAIMEVVRYHESIQRRGEFDINNNYSSYYSRAFIKKYPQHDGFFEFRRTKGLRSSRE